jgi:hypothetical protein
VGGGFPGCGPWRRFGPGPRLGWPCRLLRGGTVPCRAAPGPVPEPASPDHQRCRVMTGRLRVVLPQGPQPVLSPPAGGISRINDDNRQTRIGGHLDQPVAELPGGDAVDGTPEGPATPAARGPTARPFASFGAGGGEVQVLDDDGAGAVFCGGGDKASVDACGARTSHELMTESPSLTRSRCARLRPATSSPLRLPARTPQAPSRTTRFPAVTPVPQGRRTQARTTPQTKTPSH